MLKASLLVGAVALGLVAPAQAGAWKELRMRGVVVSASAEVVAVESALGDATLKCRVPERLAEKAAGFKPGDRVRMLCLRKRGQRAMLLKLEHLDARATKNDEVSDDAEENLGARAPKRDDVSVDSEQESEKREPKRP